MDSVTVKDVILDQKIKDKYDCNMNDFVAAQEITVTITLAEYRQLVIDSATRKEAIEKAEKDKWTRNNENDQLKAEVAKLKAELYEVTAGHMMKEDQED